MALNLQHVAMTTAESKQALEKEQQEKAKEQAERFKKEVETFAVKAIADIPNRVYTAARSGLHAANILQEEIGGKSLYEAVKDVVSTWCREEKLSFKETVNPNYGTPVRALTVVWDAVPPPEPVAPAPEPVEPE